MQKLRLLNGLSGWGVVCEVLLWDGVFCVLLIWGGCIFVLDLVIYVDFPPPPSLVMYFKMFYLLLMTTFMLWFKPPRPWFELRKGGIQTKLLVCIYMYVCISALLFTREKKDLVIFQVTPIHPLFLRHPVL